MEQTYFERIRFWHLILNIKLNLINNVYTKYLKLKSNKVIDN